MSMIFEFKEMGKANGFVAAVKQRFDLDGQAYDDANAAQAHDSKMGHAPAGHYSFPWELNAPVALIDRVGFPVDDAAIAQIKQRFGLKRVPTSWHGTHINVMCAAEKKVEALARKFGGQFVGT
jgi:hypothetical protein